MINIVKSIVRSKSIPTGYLCLSRTLTVVSASTVRIAHQILWKSCQCSDITELFLICAITGSNKNKSNRLERAIERAMVL